VARTRAVYNATVTGFGSSPLPVGAKAPPFSLRRTFEETVSLDDLLSRGPTALVFYVFDFGNI
jgi:peroxiredoxin